MGATRAAYQKLSATGLADGITNTHVREQIRRLRLARGLTQRQLARAAGISPSSLGCLESGFYRLNLDTLQKILVALNVDITAIWPSVKDKNSADMDLSLLHEVDQVSFFRLREVHLLAAAGASAIFAGDCEENGSNGKVHRPRSLRALYTINIAEEERPELARRLAEGTLNSAWLRYSHQQGGRCLLLCLKNATMRPWIESLIERYLPAWLATFRI